MELRARNITAVYRLATAEERAHGCEWYNRAHELACELDPADPVRGAAVIAVLSPRLNWDLNKRAARDAYSGIRPRVLGANADKAERILAGEDPDTVVRGDKVRAFWRAISCPDDPQAIVIDRHAFDVAAGQTTDDQTRKVLERRGQYQDVAKLYVRAAQILTRETGTLVSAVEVQAVTWVAWRRMKKEVAA